MCSAGVTKGPSVVRGVERGVASSSTSFEAQPRKGSGGRGVSGLEDTQERASEAADVEKSGCHSTLECDGSFLARPPTHFHQSPGLAWGWSWSCSQKSPPSDKTHTVAQFYTLTRQRASRQSGQPRVRELDRGLPDFGAAS